VYIELVNIANRNFGIGLQDFAVVGENNYYETDMSSRILSLYSEAIPLISSFENYPPGVPISTVLIFDINPNERSLWLVPKQAAGERIALECFSLGCTRK
jgi:hypothetical protein